MKKAHCTNGILIYLKRQHLWWLFLIWQYTTCVFSLQVLVHGNSAPVVCHHFRNHNGNLIKTLILMYNIDVDYIVTALHLIER